MDLNTDQALNEILEKIPDRDGAGLLQHGVTNLSKLMEIKSVLQQRELKHVCSDVQMILVAVCTYLESLDSTSAFTWEGFENFCNFVDNSGDFVLDTAEEIQTKKKQDNRQDYDPEGLSLTSEERKQMELSVENDPLTMKVRGFSASSLHFEVDEKNKASAHEPSEKTSVAFNGSVFYVGKCYYYQQGNGEEVLVGILKFTKNEKKAMVALIVPFQETIMGPGLEEEPPIGVAATYDEEDQDGIPTHVQVRENAGSEPIVPLASLKPCKELSSMPELMYERQQVGQPPHNFGFVYNNDGKNRREERNKIPFVDMFAGSGGFHQGVSQVPGWTGVAAVEWWETACETFRKNNPETKVYCQSVEDFIEEGGPTPAHFRKKHGETNVLLFSSPCQSFSGSNRDVDHNSEKDLYRKGLSLKLLDAMQTTGALIGVLENVEGMWRKPNIYFLKKIVLEHIRNGYQVRVRLHRAHVFGDPQARPRIVMYVGKNFVEMPNPIETHGPGKHPFVTVRNAFTALDSVLESIKNNPGTMEPIPNLEGSSVKKPNSDEDILALDKPAGTIRCGGRAWHPTKDRAISVREAATLQSYRYSYEFLGSLTDQYKQVGNAVPGKMARAIALAIKESLRFVYAEEAPGFPDSSSIVSLSNEEEDASMEEGETSELASKEGEADTATVEGGGEDTYTSEEGKDSSIHENMEEDNEVKPTNASECIVSMEQEKEGSVNPAAANENEVEEGEMMEENQEGE